MSATRSARLIEEFVAGATRPDGVSIPHGIAALLRHLADTQADPESCHAIPRRVMVDMATELTEPTLLERAMAGDPEAARQFLAASGFTDERGQLRPQFGGEVQP